MNILLTGAASGIGKAVLDKLNNNENKIYCLDINKIEENENVVSFLTDITEKESLFKVYDYLTDNNITLDCIINVAGIHMMASLVESDFSKMKRLIDINLTGTMQVNHTFHSLLNPKGRIIIVTSEVANLDPMPFNGLYNVSKTALDSYTQALRQELNLLGQKVITIRPGAIKTPLSDGSLEDTKRLAKSTRLYKNESTNFYRLVTKFMGKPIEAELISEVIYKAVTSKHPKLVYKRHHNPGLVLLNILPKRMQLFIIKLLLKSK